MEKIAFKNLAQGTPPNIYVIQQGIRTPFFGANQRPFTLNSGQNQAVFLNGQYDTNGGTFAGNSLSLNYALVNQLKVYTSFVQDGVNNYCEMKIEIIGSISGLIATSTNDVYENSSTNYSFNNEYLTTGENIYFNFRNQGGLASGIVVQTWAFMVETL